MLNMMCVQLTCKHHNRLLWLIGWLACFEQERGVEDSQDNQDGSGDKSTAQIDSEGSGAAINPNAGSKAQKSMVRIIISMYMQPIEDL